jgi:molecular chaperone DnaJ
MDLYIVLGLEQGASEAEIKRAYRRLARRFHPDINPGDRTAAERFRQILLAYETLVDPDRRSRYDAGMAAPPQPPRPSGFEGFDFTIRGVDHSATFGDLFAEVLSERGTTAAAERGSDLHQDVALTFEESMSGAERPVTVTRRLTCRACAGTGAGRMSEGGCQVCQASGVVRAARGHMVFTRRCQACGGTGQRPARACGHCAGAGHLTRTEVVQVRIPGGVTHGARVRVPGKGHAGVRGGSSGDLFITVNVAEHPTFRREGENVYVQLSLGVHEAALGADVEVPSPDGCVTLRVPPGTQSGQRFRIPGRGAPSLRDGSRGDLIVEVRLTLPPVLDERSKELLREFGRLNAFAGRDGKE